MPTEDPAENLDVPWLWEGEERGWSRPETVGWALGALARQLASHPHGDDEDRFLVRALISVDGPRGDRVWGDVERRGQPQSLRSFVTELKRQGHDFDRQGLAAWCRTLRHDYAFAFDVEPAVFYERCLPHYHGFLHAWTDEDSVHAGFKGWARRRQAAFQHEYLLYAANDARFAASSSQRPDEGLQEAAAWLKSHRCYLFRWTLVASEAPQVRPDWVADFEGTLMTDLEQFRSAAGSTPDAQWLLPAIEESFGQLFNPGPARSPLQETLSRLGADARERRRAHVFEVCHEFSRRLSSSLAGPAGDALARLRRRLEELGRWGW